MSILARGFSGDYDPDDPDDVPLVRFSCLKREGKEFEAIDDTSYCTRIPIDTERDVLKHLAEVVMKELKRAIEGGGNPKKAMEYMSWVTADELRR